MFFLFVCLFFYLIFPGVFCLTSCGEYGFVVVDEALSWTEAQKFCREQHIDLASVTTMDDVENLKRMTAQNPNEKYWIGLYFVETPWTWTLPSHVGENDTFRNWLEKPQTGMILLTAISYKYQRQCGTVFKTYISSVQ
uniref:C-type lectin domain-containing protein n=1 Tax=Salarias fasciatus TaxID=181472 RepID=A0A672FKF3_SALFA